MKRTHIPSSTARECLDSIRLWNPFLLAEVWMGAQLGAEDAEENAACPCSPEVDTWFTASR